MTDAIPVVLCVDIEPDSREVNRAAAESWTGFEKFILSVDYIRETLEAATGRSAHFTWFLRMDPQVAEVWGTPAWPAEAYARELAELTSEGDELGVHPHSWRWHDAAHRWVSDQADESWVAHCAQMALDSYRQAFGRRCEAYRHGDRSMTTCLARLIDDAGVRVDLTVEPGLPRVPGLIADELSTGWIESTLTAPTHPYRPSRDDFRVPDATRNEGLLIVPLTRGLDVDVVADRSGRPRGRWETLALWDSPQSFRGRLLHRLGDPSLVHLAFAIRSDLPMRSEWWSWFQMNLVEFCRHPMAGEFRFCTASEAANEVMATPQRRTGQVVADASISARASLWAGGSEDPGCIERAELEALRVLSEFTARHLEKATQLGADRADLAERLGVEAAAARDFAERLDAADRELRAVRETARDFAERLDAADRELRAVRETARDFAERLDAADRELRAVRETKTWRAHNRALTLLGAIRRHR
jgi:hypothetical protein